VKFGEIPVDDALGAIAAHAVKIDGLVLRKGHEITARVQAELKAAGVSTIIAAQLEVGDVGEDAAATQLAERIAGPGLRLDRAFTGRVNLFAEVAGLLEIDTPAIDAINEIDEAITVATLPAWKAVAERDMAATVKIIPFAAPGSALAAAEAAAGAGAVRIRPFRPLGVAMVSTLLPGLKLSVVAKTVGTFEERLAPLNAKLLHEARARHDTRALVEAIRLAARRADLIVVFGASAITDRRDVIPAAIEAAGGRIEHFGMPVDPGNLLLIGELDGKPVIGAPGCARSPKENGFDWVLQRLIAGVPIGRREIQRMGVGGLLMEIATRPQPRAGDD
jgi:molybdenum cofactor cytidylyltransferase